MLKSFLLTVFLFLVIQMCISRGESLSKVHWKIGYLNSIFFPKRQKDINKEIKTTKSEFYSENFILARNRF